MTITIFAVGLLLSGLVATPAPAADRTGSAETRRVDRVPAPQIVWSPCHEVAECATADLPLDYDRPHGPATTVALLRVKARDPAKRAGSLFINPGGPGSSGTAMALAAPSLLGPEVHLRQSHPAGGRAGPRRTHR